MKEKTKNECIATIKYDLKIAENALFLNDDHQNEIALRIDNITLEKPLFLIRKNPDNLADEGLEVTEKILNFLRENKENFGDKFNYDLYFNYRVSSVNCIEEMEENEEVLWITPINEDDFIKSEMRWWEYEPTEKESEFFKNLIETLKLFHNRKYHKNTNPS